VRFSRISRSIIKAVLESSTTRIFFDIVLLELQSRYCGANLYAEAELLEAWKRTSAIQLSFHLLLLLVISNTAGDYSTSYGGNSQEIDLEGVGNNPSVVMLDFNFFFNAALFLGFHFFFLAIRTICWKNFARQLLSIFEHHRPVQDSDALLAIHNVRAIRNVSRYLPFRTRWYLSCQLAIGWISLDPNSRLRNVAVRR
jgi:hypothetical protein